jgi:hypothetical protein
MSSVTLQLELPEDWADFCLPAALDARLTALLDQQDHTGALSEMERREFLFEGLTPTGRATVEALGMNRVAIVSIRKELSFLGRFP